jgi:hypothetical protein
LAGFFDAVTDFLTGTFTADLAGFFDAVTDFLTDLIIRKLLCSQTVLREVL